MKPGVEVPPHWDSYNYSIYDLAADLELTDFPAIIAGWNPRGLVLLSVLGQRDWRACQLPLSSWKEVGRDAEPGLVVD